MEYTVGVLVAMAVGAFGFLVGFDRDRAFYSTILIVVASYYILFAAMGASSGTLLTELAVASVFVLLAVLGFKSSLWWAAAGIAGHGLFDLVHGLFIQNPGMPVWWPGFCMSFDVLFGVLVGVRLLRRTAN